MGSWSFGAILVLAIVQGGGDGAVVVDNLIKHTLEHLLRGTDHQIGIATNVFLGTAIYNGGGPEANYAPGRNVK